MPLDGAQYYVSLDLGSQTMAAYCERKDTLDSAMVSLQAHAENLLGGEPDDFLEDNGITSPRLRTRIFLVDNRQPAELPDSHAELTFVNASGRPILSAYQQSLFGYFCLKDEAKQVSWKILPNPKMPFQYGAQGVIPDVKTTSGEEHHRYAPEQLLQHLTTQVVRNLVLKSPELSHVKPEQVHLTITMPNVYSMAHVQSIREFVQKHTGLAAVDVLYESDAVAYYILQTIKKKADPKEIKSFKARLLERKEQREVRILTIDIGRGTTDLSLIRIEEHDRKTEGRRRHFVLGRTGRSTGGNRLSYIFAEFYNKRLSRVLRTLGVSDLSFDFLSRARSAAGTEQRWVLRPLEQLIEEVKASVTEDYAIQMDGARQKQLIGDIFNKLWVVIEARDIHAMLEDLEDKLKSMVIDDITYNRDRTQLLYRYEQMQQVFEKFFMLPKRLPGDWAGLFGSMTLAEGVEKLRRSCNGLFRSNKAPRTRASLGASAPEQEGLDDLLCLRDEIEKYVGENVGELLHQLEAMVAARENGRGGKRPEPTGKRIYDKDSTFVLVAGQASQFAPIGKAIVDWASKQGIPPSSNVLFLKGSRAKIACCQGAVAFQRAGNRQMNPDELHGSYGLMAASLFQNNQAYKVVDMSKIKAGGKGKVTFNDCSTYWLFYTPRWMSPSEEPPSFEDERTAVIRSYEGHEFEFEYDRRAQEIKINGDRVGRLATYGDINESIYPKVWPEVVRQR